MTTISPKVSAPALADALAVLIIGSLSAWTNIFDDFSATQLTAFTGSVIVILSFAVGYLVKDPLRGGTNA